MSQEWSIEKADSHFINRFIAKYPVNRTLRWSLIPIGRTQQTIDERGFVEEDEELARDRKKMIEKMNALHRAFASQALLSVSETIAWDELVSAYNDYWSETGEDKEKARQRLERIQDNYRKRVARAFKEHDDFPKLFKKELFKELLPKLFPDDETRELLSKFDNFTSSFMNYHEARKNMYKDEKQHTAISYRLIHENLPKYIENSERWKRLKKEHPDLAKNILNGFEDLKSSINAIETASSVLDDVSFEDFFDPHRYSLVITDEGIKIYNLILGGLVLDDGTKVQGVNEFANLYFQQHVEDDVKRIRFQPLFRQILSTDKSAWSLSLEKVEDDGQLESMVGKLLEELFAAQGDASLAERTVDMLSSLSSYGLANIQVKSDRLFSLSRILYGDGYVLGSAIHSCVENGLLPVKSMNAKSKASWEKKQYWTLQELAIAKHESDAYNAESADHASSNAISETTDAADSSDESVHYTRSLPIDELGPEVERRMDRIEEAREPVKAIFASIDASKRRIIQEDPKVEMLKELMDSLLDLAHLVFLFEVPSMEERSADFYGFYDELVAAWRNVPSVYDKVRNYATQKPYSVEKFKLNFRNPSFLAGWDVNKQDENFASIFIKDGRYHLGLINPTDKISLEGLASCDPEVPHYEKVDYKLFPDPTQMIPKCTVTTKDFVDHFERSKADYVIDDSKRYVRKMVIPKSIFDLYYELLDGIAVKRDVKAFQTQYLRATGDEKGFKKALQQWIDFCLEFLESYRSTAIYDYSRCRSKDYDNLNDFYTDVRGTTYMLTFRPISCEDIDRLIEGSKLLFFEIHNKDFSEGSTGAKNLHTSYFEALFDPRNLEDVVFKLDGQAEMFYRPASIEKPIIHEVGEMLVNKTVKKMDDGTEVTESIPDDVYIELVRYANGRMQSADLSQDARRWLETEPVVIKPVDHAITKDARFTKPSYLFHVPITINFKSPGTLTSELNSEVLRALREDESVNIIGIDRGERNLLYCTVIDQNGRLLEQRSLNIINGVDYHEKLSLRERERTKQRKSWKSVNDIKNLKKGYLSAAVHEVVKMVVEYDAVLVMEDLSSGFKHSRTKFEKQVYQNFEKQLIDKLNYLAAKPAEKEITAPGGILKGYQLAGKFESFEKMGIQSGAILYVPAWNTSHIDPATGFVNLFRDLRYKNMRSAKDFFASFDSIRYAPEEGYFEFAFSYADFKVRAKPFKDDWVVCSVGDERVVQQPRKSNGKTSYEDVRLDITSKMEKLFDEYSIAYEDGEDLKPAIREQDDASFFKELLYLFRILVQMRYHTSYNSKLTDEVIDRIISPVKNEDGDFFDSDDSDGSMPMDADANGAFHIALKGLQLIREQITEGRNGSLRVTRPRKQNEKWLEFAQSRHWE